MWQNEIDRDTLIFSVFNTKNSHWGGAFILQYIILLGVELFSFLANKNKCI